MGNKKYKKRHREMGLCLDCSEPVYPDRKKCLVHLRSAAKAEQKYRLNNIRKVTEKDHRLKQARRDNGLCEMCSAPLDPDADTGRLNCVNCRGGTFEVRLIHGTAIV